MVEDIAVRLIEFAKFYTNPVALGDLPYESSQRRDYEFAANVTRELAALLEVTTNNINGYRFWEKVHFIKVSKENVLNAAGKLIGLSNSYGNHGRGFPNSDLADEIRNLLNIPKVK